MWPLLPPPSLSISSRPRLRMMRRITVLILGIALPLVTAVAGDVRLVGTVMLGNDGGRASHAVFETDDGRQLIVEHDQQINGCMLVEVRARDVRMACADGEISLVLRARLRAADYEPPTTPFRYDINLPQEDFLRALSDRQRMTSQISLEPEVREGYLEGYRVAWVLPGGDFHRLGLQDGDVILSLNGVAASDPGNFMQTLNSMRGQRSFELIVARDGQSLAYSYVLD